MRANRVVHGSNKGAHKGGRFSKNHRRLQAIGALYQPIGIEDNFSLTSLRRRRTIGSR
jgi:hypothetical protein